MRWPVFVFLGMLVWGSAMAFGGTNYLWGEISVPQGALEGLGKRAESLGIPTAVWTEEGLSFTGVADEAELLAGELWLYWDGPYFMLGSQTSSGRVFLRGGPDRAELIVQGDGALSRPTPEFFELLISLGLFPRGTTVELELRDVPLKLPKPPEGMSLDPVLWALVGHPDWFGFARDYGLLRVGLRVRVVAEVEGRLALSFEPYIQSSSDNLCELLLPIPLLPELGQDPAVRYARPPHVPYPAEGGSG